MSALRLHVTRASPPVPAHSARHAADIAKRAATSEQERRNAEKD